MTILRFTSIFALSFVSTVLLNQIEPITEIEFDPLEKAINFGGIGLIIWWEYQQIQKTINGVGGRIEALKDEILDMSKTLEVIEKYIDKTTPSFYNTKSRFNYDEDERE